MILLIVRLAEMGNNLESCERVVRVGLGGKLETADALAVEIEVTKRRFTMGKILFWAKTIFISNKMEAYLVRRCWMD